jgi:fatty acid-binding protein DegV
MRKLADHAVERHAPGTAMRFQFRHGYNADGAATLHEKLGKLKCDWLPTGPIAPVLGAHTGPGLAGLA